MMYDPFSYVLNWEFLDEPLWRWFFGLGAIAALIWAWDGILSYMR